MLYHGLIYCSHLLETKVNSIEYQRQISEDQEWTELFEIGYVHLCSYYFSAMCTMLTCMLWLVLCSASISMHGLECWMS
jgi:hypothetical protein